MGATAGGMTICVAAEPAADPVAPKIVRICDSLPMPASESRFTNPVPALTAAAMPSLQVSGSNKREWAEMMSWRELRSAGGGTAATSKIS